MDAQQQQQTQPQDGQKHHKGFRPQIMTFDGKRMRKQIARKYVDFGGTIINSIYSKNFRKTLRENYYAPPHAAFSKFLLPPADMASLPASSVCTRFAHASANKNKCPINIVTWTPQGRRLITGCATGEFTLWNGTAFNFETIQQAHDHPIRAMTWSHNEEFMVSSDNTGIVKYWTTTLNNVKAFSAHSQCIRDISFCPTDAKYATCSDDGSSKIWDFEKCTVDRTCTGHGSHVICCDWHPFSSLVATGGKDNLVKIWDAKSASCVVTLYGHKNAISRVKFNHRNGNWLLTGSRDHLIKVYDIRYMKDFQTFRGHKKEVTTIRWHPFNERLFASADYGGSIHYWQVGFDAPIGKIPTAHDSNIWDIAWHPFGHVLCSGSNDQTTKFWIRNRPGDDAENMKDANGVVEEGGDGRFASNVGDNNPQQNFMQQKEQGYVKKERFERNFNDNQNSFQRPGYVKNNFNRNFNRNYNKNNENSNDDKKSFQKSFVF